jgi:hypothetical protein
VPGPDALSPPSGAVPRPRGLLCPRTPYVTPIGARDYASASPGLSGWGDADFHYAVNFALTEFSEVARQASGSGIMFVVERVKVNYATPWPETKAEDDA